MEDLSSGSESDYSATWISWFLSTKGNEYFAEVDEDYILDRFNLTGLNGEVVQEYSRALDLITDQLDDESLDDDVREAIETSARFLYGLIHARYIITSRGLAKMLEKYRKADFGRCPRVYCYNQALLPVGLSDVPYQKAVKLYCPRCEDIYSPKSNRHGSIDGAYFGTTFPHMLFMVYPQMIPSKGQNAGEGGPRSMGMGSGMGMSGMPGNGGSLNFAGRGGGGGGGSGGPGTGAGAGGAGLISGQGMVSPGEGSPAAVGSVSTATAGMKAEKYEPRMYGFRVHEEARLSRWRLARRDTQIARLEALERETNQPNL